MQSLERDLTLDASAALKERIATRTALVGVVGAGYVGLPLAVEKAKVGFEVICYDRNAERVGKINAGENYIRDVVDAELREAVRLGKLQASCDLTDLRRRAAEDNCIMPAGSLQNRETLRFKPGGNFLDVNLA